MEKQPIGKKPEMTIDNYYQRLKQTSEGRKKIVGEMLSAGLDPETIIKLGYKDVLEESNQVDEEK